ncbi:MAG TPA: hypothetical protein VJM83_04185 [Nitrospirota bacterium]|nr:hypothetical protein [Nitrospirota bacterium]
MGYFEIIKEGVRIANRNLAVLLTQFLAGLAMVLAFFVLFAAFLIMALGSLPGLTLGNFSADELSGLVEKSITLIAGGFFLVLVFVIFAAFLTSFVHSGNLGCVIETARGRAAGFTSGTFFGTGRRSMLSMLGLYIIFGLIALGGLVVIASAAGVGLGGVLIPLKEAGKGLVAFGLGVPFIIALILAGLLFLYFLYAGWAFSGVILVGEARGPLSSLSAAYNFIRKHFWDSLLFALLMFLLVFIANVITSVLGVPFGIDSERPALALGLMPLLLLNVLVQMYVGLVARSSFVVYYLLRSNPPAPPAVSEAPPVQPVAETPPLNFPRP